SYDLPEVPDALRPGGRRNDPVGPAGYCELRDLLSGSAVEEFGGPGVAHLRHHEACAPVIGGCVHAGLHCVGSGEAVADDRGEPGIEDLLGDQPVRVGDVGNLEISDEREIQRLEIPRYGEAGREDERVTELDRVEVWGA